MSTAINKLPEKTRSKIQELLDDIKSGGHYFVIKSGQPPQKITLNMDYYLGKIKRTISLPNGDIREINQHAFSIWNHTYQISQQLSLSNRWVKGLLQTMLAHNTNTVIVKRQGPVVKLRVETVEELKETVKGHLRKMPHIKRC